MVADHADAIVERVSARRALNDLAPRARAVLVLRWPRRAERRNGVSLTALGTCVCQIELASSK